MIQLSVSEQRNPDNFFFCVGDHDSRVRSARYEPENRGGVALYAMKYVHGAVVHKATPCFPVYMLDNEYVGCN